MYLTINVSMSFSLFIISKQLIVCMHGICAAEISIWWFVCLLHHHSSTRGAISFRNVAEDISKCYEGTQKFELPKSEVTIANVFRAVENAKTKFSIQAWGLADTTLDDVFIKVANEASNGEARLS